jgi:hypothetical protein
MLGHYINVQPEKVWDRWLTKPFRPGPHAPVRGPKDCGCLVGEANFIARGGHYGYDASRIIIWGMCGEYVGNRFDDLCERFGPERIQRAVRNRILTMQAHKALRSPPVRDAVVSGVIAGDGVSATH